MNSTNKFPLSIASGLTTPEIKLIATNIFIFKKIESVLNNPDPVELVLKLQT